ncbi:MAG: hypothetical protein WDN28_12060 [Chthoniobacter sp.]
MNGHLSFWLAISLCLAAQRANAGDFQIVPGQRLGNVVLGHTEKQIHQALGAPDTTVRLPHGLVREDWLSQHLAPKSYVEDGLYYKHDFVTVYFRQGRAIQAEASSPAFQTARSLTRASGGLQFRTQYPDFQTLIPPHVSNPDPGGCPARKHYFAYDDVPSQGIAWRYGAWGDLAPEPNFRLLEMVIVHPLGRPVVVDPMAASASSGPSRPRNSWNTIPKSNAASRCGGAFFRCNSVGWRWADPAGLPAWPCSAPHPRQPSCP